MSTIICLDLGIAHTGLAISREGILAEPLATIFEAQKEKLLGKLLPFIAKNSPDALIIGVPPYGPLVQRAQGLKDELGKVFTGEIILFPEDNSSRSARSVMKENHKTLDQRKQEEHQTAAALILQEYLDSL